MKLVLRTCVWETNSSTTHAYAELSRVDYEKWEHEGYYVFLGSFISNSKGEWAKEGKLYTKEEVLDFVEKSMSWRDYPKNIAELDENDLDYYCNECGFFNYSSYVRADDMDVISPTVNYIITRTWYDG